MGLMSMAFPYECLDHFLLPVADRQLKAEVLSDSMDCQSLQKSLLPQQIPLYAR
jgi:hypothetical protein